MIRRILFSEGTGRCTAAAVTLISLSFATTGEARVRIDLTEIIRFHSSTPIVNDVGLKMHLSCEPAMRFVQRWIHR